MRVSTETVQLSKARSICHNKKMIKENDKV